MQNTKRNLGFFICFIPVVLFFLFLINSASALTPTGGSCVNSAPATSTVPDMSAVVNQVASEHPDWLTSSCNDYRYLDEVVRRLRTGTGGTKWAFEGKRADLNDPWKEGISYYYGTGNAPQTGSMTNYEVFAVDIAHQDCANPSNTTSNWIVADWPYRQSGVVEVAYLYPRNAGGSLPSPVACSGQPTTPTGPPTIDEIAPQTAAIGENVEIFGTNLVDSVRLENLSGGEPHSVIADVRAGATIASFQVPDIAGGVYKISVSGPQGSTESPQNLTIRRGGSSFGQPIRPEIPTEGLPTFGALVETIFTWSLNILGIVVFVMIFFAGFKLFTAAGNTAKLNEAKSQITNAVTGAIILLAAWIILYTINPDLVGGTFTLPGIGTTTTGTSGGGGGTGGGGGGGTGACRNAGGTANYSGALKNALDAVINANQGGIANALNTTSNSFTFLGFVVQELQANGFNATTDVLNGNDNPNQGDLVAVWKNSDSTVERYDVVAGVGAGNTPLREAGSEIVEFSGDIPLSCVR